MTNIKAERAKRGWTQEQLAGFAGVSHASVSKAERCVLVQPDIMEKILLALESNGTHEIVRLPPDLKARREELNLSRSLLARLSNVHERTIENIECGRTNPAIQTINKILDGLQLAAEGRTAYEVRHEPSVHEADIGEPVTQADMLRRAIISNADLIGAGRVKCPKNPALCQGDCMQCKTDWLNSPYA